MDEILSELQRIFLGDKSLTFLVEVAFRTTIIFVYTLVLLRFMGKRGMGQLTPFEFAIIVALGSAVGDPMFYDDVPLVHTMLVIAIVIGLQRVVNLLTRRSGSIESFVEGQSEKLIENGQIDLMQMNAERLSQEELFELLRPEGVSHLGQVRQAFLEPSGRLSVIRWAPPRPGLSVFPGVQHGEIYEQTAEVNKRCCTTCGGLEMKAVQTDALCCESCGGDGWCAAITAKG